MKSKLFFSSRKMDEKLSFSYRGDSSVSGGKAYASITGDTTRPGALASTNAGTVPHQPTGLTLTPLLVGIFTVRNRLPARPRRRPLHVSWPQELSCCLRTYRLPSAWGTEAGHVCVGLARRFGVEDTRGAGAVRFGACAIYSRPGSAGDRMQRGLSIGTLFRRPAAQLPC